MIINPIEILLEEQGRANASKIKLGALPAAPARPRDSKN